MWVPYESGLQSDEEFRVFLCEHLSLNCTDSEFDEAFSALLLDFHHGVYDWVESLTSSFQLYLLSNTSSIHAKRFTQVKLGPEGQNLIVHIGEETVGKRLEQGEPNWEQFSHMDPNRFYNSRNGQLIE